MARQRPGPRRTPLRRKNAVGLAPGHRRQDDFHSRNPVSNKVEDEFLRLSPESIGASIKQAVEEGELSPRQLEELSHIDVPGLTVATDKGAFDREAVASLTMGPPNFNSTETLFVPSGSRHQRNAPDGLLNIREIQHPGKEIDALLRGEIDQFVESQFTPAELLPTPASPLNAGALETAVQGVLEDGVRQHLGVDAIVPNQTPQALDSAVPVSNPPLTHHIQNGNLDRVKLQRARLVNSTEPVLDPAVTADAIASTMERLTGVSHEHLRAHPERHLPEQQTRGLFARAASKDFVLPLSQLADANDNSDGGLSGAIQLEESLDRHHAAFSDEGTGRSAPGSFQVAQASVTTAPSYTAELPKASLGDLAKVMWLVKTGKKATPVGAFATVFGVRPAGHKVIEYRDAKNPNIVYRYDRTAGNTLTIIVYDPKTGREVSRQEIADSQIVDNGDGTFGFTGVSISSNGGDDSENQSASSQASSGPAAAAAAGPPEDEDPDDDDREISFSSQSKLQKKYSKHGHIFGLPRNYSRQNGEAFKMAIRDHMKDPNTQVVKGTHRTTQKVTHYFNPKTRVNVMKDQNGEFVSAWRLSDDQIKHLLTSGNIQ